MPPLVSAVPSRRAAARFPSPGNKHLMKIECGRADARPKNWTRDPNKIITSSLRRRHCCPNGKQNKYAVIATGDLAWGTPRRRHNPWERNSCYLSSIGVFYMLLVTVASTHPSIATTPSPSHSRHQPYFAGSCSFFVSNVCFK